MQGSVFATGTTLQTPPIALGLSCKDGVTGTDGAVPVEAPESASPAKASPPPKGLRIGDASAEQTTTTPGSSAPASDNSSEPGAKSAGGCRIGVKREEGEPPWSGLALLLLVAAPRRRRRRRAVRR